MSNTPHRYSTRIIWEGNRGEGTSGYTTYGRTYRVVTAEKPDLVGSADPRFRGERDKYNPEDLFLASVASCHMLFYLSLCSRAGVQVIAYQDEAEGTLSFDEDGGGRFTDIVLHPLVTIASAESAAAAADLHAEAHRRCFIANSCATFIRCVATVQIQAPEQRR